MFTSFRTVFLSVSDENLQDKKGEKNSEKWNKCRNEADFGGFKGVAEPEFADLIERKSAFTDPPGSATARHANRCVRQLLPPAADISEHGNISPAFICE